MQSLDYSAEDVEEAAEVGVELPSPDNEEFGGFCYEMLYLDFRIRPEPYLLDEELDQFFEEYIKPKKERLAEIFEPDYGDYLAYKHASTTFREHERYGKPYSGGYREQPAEWLFVMHCVMTAKERAETLSNREEAKYNKDKATAAQSDVPSTSDIPTTYSAPF